MFPRFRDSEKLRMLGTEHLWLDSGNHWLLVLYSVT